MVVRRRRFLGTQERAALATQACAPVFRGARSASDAADPRSNGIADDGW